MVTKKKSVAADNHLVQAWFPAHLYEYAASQANRDGATVAEWLRRLVERDQGASTVHAWPCGPKDPGDDIQRWEDSDEGYYELRALGPHVAGYGTYTVRQRVENGYSTALGQRELGATLFHGRDPRYTLLYVRGGSFWRIIPVFHATRDGAAILSLKYAGLTFKDAMKVSS